MKKFRNFAQSLMNKAKEGRVNANTVPHKNEDADLSLYAEAVAGLSPECAEEVEKYLRGDKDPLQDQWCPEALRNHPKLRWYWDGLEIFDKVFRDGGNARIMTIAPCGSVVLAVLEEGGGKERYVVTDGNRSFDVTRYYPPYGHSLRNLLYALPADMAGKMEPLYYDYMKALDEAIVAEQSSLPIAAAAT